VSSHPLRGEVQDSETGDGLVHDIRGVLRDCSATDAGEVTCEGPDTSSGFDWGAGEQLIASAATPINAGPSTLIWPPSDAPILVTHD
jgi:hypothetical protein